MFFSLFLVWLARHSSLLVFCICCFYLFLFVRLVLVRAPYLSFVRPRLPLGHMRIVKLTSREEVCAKEKNNSNNNSNNNNNRDERTTLFFAHSYYSAFWYVMSLFTVPYESMVLFIDHDTERVQKTSTATASATAPVAKSTGYILTAQERQHSVVHSVYNSSVLRSLELQVDFLSSSSSSLSSTILSLSLSVVVHCVRFIGAFFTVLTRLFKQHVSEVIIHTLIVLIENSFYYERSIDELFETFAGAEGEKQHTKQEQQQEGEGEGEGEQQTEGKKRNLNTIYGIPILNKVFLWHHYEELEHHMEAVSLYIDTFGSHRFWLLPLCVPVYSAVLYLVRIFACILLACSCNPFLSNLPSSSSLSSSSSSSPSSSSSSSLSLSFSFSPLSSLRWFLGVIRSLVVDLVYLDLTAVFSASIIFIGLVSRESKMDDDLELFRRKFKEKYDVQLSENQIAL